MLSIEDPWRKAGGPAGGASLSPGRDFTTDKKWCPACDKHVSYLESLEHSYCAECEGRVQLFSPDGRAAFKRMLAERPKPKKGRPKKQTASPS